MLDTAKSYGRCSGMWPLADSLEVDFLLAIPSERAWHMGIGPPESCHDAVRILARLLSVGRGIDVITNPS